MELTLENIVKCLNGWMRYIVDNPIKVIKTCLAYMFVYATFVALTLFALCYGRIKSNPLGWYVSTLCLIGAYCMYLVINHLFTSRAISHKILLMIEFILLVTLITTYLGGVFYTELSNIFNHIITKIVS